MAFNSSDCGPCPFQQDFLGRQDFAAGQNRKRFNFLPGKRLNRKSRKSVVVFAGDIVCEAILIRDKTDHQSRVHNETIVVVILKIMLTGQVNCDCKTGEER